jgi:hypothetical protein
MTRSILVATTLVLVAAGVAGAQTVGQRVVERPKPGPRQEGMVRVQLSMQMFLAGPTDETEEAEKNRARGRQVIYDLAAKECDLLRGAIAQDCRLEAVNVNLNRQSQQNMQGYNVNGSMTFQITLK